jgi:parallel beta-helix repeat protein
MKPKINLLSIILSFVLILSAEGVYASCVIPRENLIINQSTTFCTGTYYLNDSEGNGAIIINANSLDLDCQGAHILGKSMLGSTGFSIIGKSNVTIKNCFISNYSDQGIYLSGVANSLIEGNHIFNVKSGIVAYNSYSNNFKSNLIENTSIIGDQSNYGVRLGGYSSKENLVSGNVLRNFRYGVGLKEGANNDTIIFNNSFYDTGQYGVMSDDGTNFTRVLYNYFQNCLWNCIESRGWFWNISYNNIITFRHHGIDTLHSTDNQARLSGGLNAISHNYIRNTNLTNTQDVGIYIATSQKNFIYKNIINASKLTSEGNTSITFGNKISENIIDGADEGALYSNDLGSTWFNNTIINTLDYDVYIGSFWMYPWMLNNDSFQDNKYPEGSANYVTFLGNTDYLISEFSSRYHRIQFSNTGKIIFNYSGYKQIHVKNITVYPSNLHTPFNDIYNQTGHRLIATNVNN